MTESTEGSPLADELKGEPLMPDRALDLLTRVAEQLAVIHQTGRAHGDLRPATLILVKGPSGEQVRLLPPPPVAPSDGATVVGPVLGPIEYFSPEQLTGAQATPPSDLFAFGVVAYQVLSGVLPPKPDPKPLAVAAPHLADQHGLCGLVMQCLATAPADRPASAAELAKKLAKLPRPTEPTIFLEAMQRPPPVPVTSSPQAAPPPLPLPPAKEAPRPLLASVQTMTVQQIPTGLVGPLASAAIGAAPKRWQRIGAGLALATVLTVGAVVYLSGSTKREARALIERRQPAEALEIIGKAQRKLDTPNPALSALKVAALHLTDAHADEAAAFQVLPAGERSAFDPLVLAGLVEDFAKKEDAGLRALLGGLPPKQLHPVLEGFAQEPLSARQWGALRYLDLEAATGSLGLAALYASSLESKNCDVRRAAARRLGQLMDDSVEPALGRLRDAPRDGAEKNCGQDEALAALQALKKSR